MCLFLALEYFLVYMYAIIYLKLGELYVRLKENHHSSRGLTFQEKQLKVVVVVLIEFVILLVVKNVLFIVKSRCFSSEVLFLSSYIVRKFLSALPLKPGYKVNTH